MIASIVVWLLFENIIQIQQQHFLGYVSIVICSKERFMVLLE